MDEIAAAAKVRMDAVAHHSDQQYAEILFMTQDEASEFLALRLSLPSNGQERQEATERLIAKRRNIDTRTK
jgi:hypothetical protein